MSADNEHEQDAANPLARAWSVMVDEPGFEVLARAPSVQDASDSMPSHGFGGSVAQESYLQWKNDYLGNDTTGTADFGVPVGTSELNSMHGVICKLEDQESDGVHLSKSSRTEEKLDVKMHGRVLKITDANDNPEGLKAIFRENPQITCLLYTSPSPRD